MHPRNRYRDHPLDFGKLAEKHPPLRQFLTTDDSKELNLSDDPHAIAELVKALIHVDWGVTGWEGVPEGYLVPSVTRSLNYLHFVEDLIAESRAKGVSSGSLISQNTRDGHQVKRVRRDDGIRVRGLDVGIGSSCIFPILGCAMHCDWYFVGFDIDETSVEFAKRNSKQFRDRIHVWKSELRDKPDMVGTWKQHSIESSAATEEAAVPEAFDFVMCNPPFFTTPPEEGVVRPFGGTALERSCPGGEVEFVSHIIEQSLQLKEKVIWFTSMLGVKESLSEILAKLHRDASAETIRVYRLDQGNKNRWVVAWSFFKQLALNAIYGQELAVDNITSSQDSLDKRMTTALHELHNFTIETGICGGPGYRFRVRVNRNSDLKFSVDVLDLKGGEEAESRAKSLVKKLEQLILRKSRKWRKRQGPGYRQHHSFQPSKDVQDDDHFESVEPEGDK